MVPKRIFETKRDEVIEEYSRLHNDDLRDLCFYQFFFA